MFTLACDVKAHEERKFHTCGTGRSATSGSHPRRTSNGRGGSMDADMRGDESRQKMRTYRQWDSPPPPPSPPPRVPRRSFTSQRGMGVERARTLLCQAYGSRRKMLTYGASEQLCMLLESQCQQKGRSANRLFWKRAYGGRSLPMGRSGIA